MKYINITIDFHEAILEISQFFTIQKTTDAHGRPSLNFMRLDANDVFVTFATSIERDKKFSEIQEVLCK